MSTAVKHAICIIYEWQTLIAGILALIAGISAVWMGRKQIRSNEAIAIRKEKEALEFFKREFSEPLKLLNLAWVSLEKDEEKNTNTRVYGVVRPANEAELTIKRIELYLDLSMRNMSFSDFMNASELIEYTNRSIKEIKILKEIDFEEFDFDARMRGVAINLSHLHKACENFNWELSKIFDGRKKFPVDWSSMSKLIEDGRSKKI